MNRTIVLGLGAFAAIAFLLMAATGGLAHASTVPAGSAGTCRQSSIALGSAANYTVLAGSTVTNTGATSIRGSLAVSPGNAVTGFPPGIVTGSIQLNTTSAQTAQKDLLTAFNVGAGLSNCGKKVSGNLGGLTLGPGLYISTSSLALSSGNLTLDAKGHPSAVFIFQMASTLTVTSGLHVTLAGGANATHIFWIVGSSATFGTTCVVYGNVLVQASISMSTGAKIHGRALAITGAVTLQKNQISA